MNKLFRSDIKPIENGVRTQFTDIIIKPGFIKEIHDFLQQKSSGRKYAIITDSVVVRLYGYRLHQYLRDSDLNAELFEFPTGECSKNVETWYRLVKEMEGFEYGKNSVIIALGGGVVGDVAGYVAAAYKRGVPYVQIPTTLLAQVDSSLGGKTGLNTRHGKNLIGAFHQPSMDLIDPETVQTLPENVYRNSLAEIIKYGAIDPQFRKDLEKNLDFLLNRNIEHLTSVILDSLIIKSFYVDKDPFDKDIRQILNFGHTIGHGIEFASDYKLPHGMAISIGMAYEGKAAVSRKEWTENELMSLNNLLQRAGLPTEIPSYLNTERLIKVIRHDKKREGIAKFVIPGSDPLTPIRFEMNEDEIRELLSE